MGFVLEKFLVDRREAIIAEWIDRLMTEVGTQYANRPHQELVGTVSDAFDANFSVLVHGDFKPIDQFIRKITTLRLEAGFMLSDVQMAFEIFRSIALPQIAAETSADEFLPVVMAVNRCLTYTLHRFSDHFQAMHQGKILEHNRRLEEMVRARTAELEESQRKYKTLVEEINDGYFVLQDEIVVFANPAFCQMHGYDLSEVIGEKFYTFIDLESRAEVIRLYEKSLEKKTVPPRTFEYLRLTKDGRSYPTEILAKVIYYENRLSNIGICRDITQRVKLERKIRESERMAYIGQVTTSLSHEIRNPLSSVQMNLQILKKHPQLKGNDQKRIDICVREVQRLEHILKELLDFAKPIQLRRQHFSLNDLLRFSIELLEMRFKEKEISVITELDAHLPDIRADKDKLGQAAINLLLNALEASSPNGCIKVSCRRAPLNKDLFQVEISDQGCGIPEACVHNIFEPFFTTKSKGTGLGLNNVKRIVEAHSGRIEFDNLDPCGVAFRILLPFEHG
ncbi:MAG: PAS domain S-box protein [Desulfobacteraceae bacterium]